MGDVHMMDDEANSDTVVHLGSVDNAALAARLAENILSSSGTIEDSPWSIRLQTLTPQTLAALKAFRSGKRRPYSFQPPFSFFTFPSLIFTDSHALNPPT